jgi:hypothetical protein
MFAGGRHIGNGWRWSKFAPAGLACQSGKPGRSERACVLSPLSRTLTRTKPVVLAALVGDTFPCCV